MKDNKLTHPVIIIWSAIIILVLLSSVKLPVVPYVNNYSHIDLLHDIRPDIKPVLPPAKKIQRVIAKSGKPVLPAAVFDSSLIIDYADDSLATMQWFYKKLNAIKSSKGKVRIAYFGDSFIESDNITGQLRNRLQQLYGGNGIGFIPMQSVVADDYLTVRFDNNMSWSDYNFHNNPQKYTLGLMGHVFYSKGDSWSQYSAINRKFRNVYLFTGKSGNAADSIFVEKEGKADKIALANDAYINKTVLNDGSQVSKLKVTCTNTSLPVYGISIEDSTGVYIDNYGFRGNTGALTLQLQPEVMRGFNNYFNYDLIIVHYGLNAIVHNDTNYAWFDRCMAKLIQKIKASYPGVPVLLISTSDVAYNEQGSYITDPAVPVLVKQQNDIARSNKTAFWNLYYSMGGQNTISNWVEGDTTYAYKDYMHVNPRGADRIAGIFMDKLLQSQKK
ncbi:MAG TPA: GDSL-type esterase/lipase family protein [Chitinophagaceae bacterium]|nr:GDSL-type esterase/lipase family protein [Chitinophagaceae bacterium]